MELRGPAKMKRMMYNDKTSLADIHPRSAERKKRKKKLGNKLKKE